MNPYPLVEKIKLLESKLGRKYSHRLLEPFKFDSSNPIEVQKAAKKIAKHIGLPPLTFVISYTHQNENIGGHIHLDQNKEVFIEVAHRYKSDSDIVSSILAHEICHKYLYLNNIKLFPEFENEILTDITTIYTGLGKISLNGCEKINTTSVTHGGQRSITTTTCKVGYMNKQQFAFAYKLFSETKGLKFSEMYKGLSTSALKEVRAICKSQKTYFDEHLVKKSIINKLILTLNGFFVFKYFILSNKLSGL